MDSRPPIGPTTVRTRDHLGPHGQHRSNHCLAELCPVDRLLPDGELLEQGEIFQSQLRTVPEQGAEE